jgi:hypothetical protein
MQKALYPCTDRISMLLLLLLLLLLLTCTL